MPFSHSFIDAINLVPQNKGVYQHLALKSVKLHDYQERTKAEIHERIKQASKDSSGVLVDFDTGNF
jgi:hypothetical protein